MLCDTQRRLVKRGANGLSPRFFGSLDMAPVTDIEATYRRLVASWHGMKTSRATFQKSVDAEGDDQISIGLEHTLLPRCVCVNETVTSGGRYIVLYSIPM